MRPIQDSRISLLDDKWLVRCVCGKESAFLQKSNALRMLNRGSCRHCCRDYRSTQSAFNIYKNSQGKWCSVCSGCGNEQAYTRQSHAKQSEVGDWQCRKCVGKAKGFAANLPVGDERRLYNKFRKSANYRGIHWNLTYKEFVDCYSGECALTGWKLSMKLGECTASLDRVDSSKPYEIGNIQWVHSMVNMCKNKYSQQKFVEMCWAVANKVKW